MKLSLVSLVLLLAACQQKTKIFGITHLNINGTEYRRLQNLDTIISNSDTMIVDIREVNGVEFQAMPSTWRLRPYQTK